MTGSPIRHVRDVCVYGIHALNTASTVAHDLINQPDNREISDVCSGFRAGVHEVYACVVSVPPN